MELRPPSASSLVGGGFALPPLWLALLLAASACQRAAEERKEVGPRDRTDVLAAAAAVESAPQPAPAGRCIDVAPGGTIRVSRDSVGPIPSRATFNELRARCPGARDTVIYSYEYVGPGLAIPAPLGTTVFAGQSIAMVYDDSTGSSSLAAAQPDKPTNYWVLHGDAIELPGGARGGAPWRELVRRYGPALIITELSRLDVRFCGLPDFYFIIDAFAHFGPKDSFTMLDSLSPGIPADAQTLEITLGTDTLPPSNPTPAECRQPGRR